MEETLSKEVEKSTKKIAKESLEYMKRQYSSKKLEGHIGKLKLREFKENNTTGFVLSSGNDEVAIYNEFGTGIVGAGTNKMAGDLGYQYNVGPYIGYIPEGAIAQYGLENCEKWTTPNTWWYLKDGKWHHTEGMKGKNMYSSLVDKLNETAVKDIKLAVKQTIGNYNSRR